MKKLKKYRYESYPVRREAERQARELYRQLFRKEFPKGWRIHFGTAGVCNHVSKEIHIAAWEPYEGLRTVLHEFIHLEHPDWPHNEKFARLEDYLQGRVIRK